MWAGLYNTIMCLIDSFVEDALGLGLNGHQRNELGAYHAVELMRAGKDINTFLLVPWPALGSG